MRSYLKTEATFAEKTMRLDGNRVEERKTHFKCVQIYNVEEGVHMFLSFWEQD